MIDAILNLDAAAALHTTLAVSVLICLVMLVRQPVARRFGGKAAYALWAIPFARLVMPSLPAGWSPVGGLFVTRAPAPDIVLSPAKALAGPPAPQGPPEVLILDSSTAPVVEWTPAAPIEHAGAGWLNHSLFANLDWLALALSVWLIGAVVAIGMMMHRQRAFNRVVEAERAVPSPELQALSDEVAATIKLRRAPQVATSLISSGPLVTGIKRPLVLMPSWFEDDYSRTEQIAALTHELTHIKRRDLWTLQLAQVFLALQWFNPLAYVAVRAFRSDQEAACDADVLGCGVMSPHAYGSTLMKVVRGSTPHRQAAQAANLPASLPLTHAIKERLILMQRPTPTKNSRRAGTALTGILGALALLATAGSAANADDQDGTTMSIGEDQFIIDGREIKDRRFILLTDPMDGMEDRFAAFAEIGEMATRIDVSRLEALDGLGDLEALTALGTLSGLDEALANLDLNIEVTEGEDGSMTIVIPETEINIQKLLADADVWVADLEAKAEVFEAEMEAWGTEFEADMEVWATEFEANFDDEFGEDIAARTDIIRALAEECETKVLSANAPVIMERTVDGKSYKALCNKGDKAALKTDAMRDFVETYPGLTKDEIKAFLETQKHNSTTIMRFDRSRDDTDQSVE